MLRWKQYRWTSAGTLAFGLTLAFASGWFDREAVAATSEAVAHSAQAVSGRLFAVASIFVLIAVLERQHCKTLNRLRSIEEELAALKAPPLSTIS